MMREIVKFGTFDLDEFIQWQMEKKRHISQVTPLIESIRSDSKGNDVVDINIKPVERVFVIYVEEIEAELAEVK